ncbi:MAG: 4Fe-4S dicluster domain-containing protein [Acidobacteria bacterium]|nr:4Fe-4S dicluster domain-containing protein [Acidobacteriota bacterium]
MNAGVGITEKAAGAQKAKRARGLVYIDVKRCKGCGFCIAFCPPGVLEFSEEFNAQGYHSPRLVDPEECTGCDLCGSYCPDFAIYAVMLKKEQSGRGAGRGSLAGEEAVAS